MKNDHELKGSIFRLIDGQVAELALERETARIDPCGFETYFQAGLKVRVLEDLRARILKTIEDFQHA